MEKENDKDLEEFDVEDIDFEAIYKAMEEIEKERQARFNAMTDAEKADYIQFQKDAEKAMKISEEIEQRRIEREIAFSKMSPEEAFEAYNQIVKNADEFANEIGMESVTIEELNAKKNKK